MNTLKSKNRLSLAIFFGAIAIAPILALIAAELLSKTLNCVVREAGPTNCIMFGIDIGNILAVLYVAGWAILLTLPTAGVASIILYIKTINARLKEK
ncbi:hypothetical protein [Pseudoalteromonas ulvae]|uniref:Uncharacterized protein n=1 Tax=Pseudoalteromonas ulvae TaxID=107327 RepID=A0A244CUC1_PSEDV|nr:hypothetical protein [Pseudoalteromonas ulvae]OUL59222.1 hypothetical protein B1199_02855 [Pseudoalteromonas ulvae]